MFQKTNNSVSISQVEVLFDREQCFQVECFTKHCVDLLASKKLVLFYKGQARTLGGSDLRSAKLCALKRMKACSCLCRDTVAAEFPSFDIVMQFKAFNLTNDGGRTPSFGTNKESLNKLGKLFGVSTVALTSEFQKVSGVAA